MINVKRIYLILLDGRFIGSAEIHAASSIEKDVDR